MLTTQRSEADGAQALAHVWLAGIYSPRFQCRPAHGINPRDAFLVQRFLYGQNRENNFSHPILVLMTTKQSLLLPSDHGFMADGFQMYEPPTTFAVLKIGNSTDEARQIRTGVA